MQLEWRIGKVHCVMYVPLLKKKPLPEAGNTKGTEGTKGWRSTSEVRVTVLTKVGTRTRARAGVGTRM